MKRSLPLFALALAGCPDPVDSGDPAPEAWSECHTEDGHDFEIAAADTAGPPAVVEGDTLFVDVAYGGGCEEHVFVPCWSGLFVDSGDLVQTNVELWHGGPEDTCEAYLQETLEIDLVPLKDAWKALHPGEGASLHISLDGTPEPALYTFE